MHRAEISRAELALWGSVQSLRFSRNFLDSKGLNTRVEHINKSKKSKAALVKKEKDRLKAVKEHVHDVSLQLNSNTGKETDREDLQWRKDVLLGRR